MRVRVLKLNANQLLSAFRRGSEQLVDELEGLPPDARAYSAPAVCGNEVRLLVESREYPDVPPHAPIPEQRVKLIRRKA